MDNLNRHYFQRRHMNDQHENMLNITNDQGNANQNHNELPPHTSVRRAVLFF